MYVSFASHDLASLYQSYWRDRSLFTTPHTRDENGRITEKGQCKLINCGPAGVVGKKHYKRGPYDRTYTRWGSDIWQFWGPSHNQRITREMAGLNPLPDRFWFNGVWVTKARYGY